jgi:hypothetical protein
MARSGGLQFLRLSDNASQAVEGLQIIPELGKVSSPLLRSCWLFEEYLQLAEASRHSMTSQKGIED